MPETKESLARLRQHNVLKSTVDKADKLTANAELSSVVIFREELDISWANYIAAFNTHEETIIDKDDTTVTAINQEFTAIHNAYLSSKLHLGKLASANQTGGALNSTMFDPAAHAQEVAKAVKMPPVKISTFSGEVSQWTEFKATCRSILTERIPDVQRLQYLKEALDGEPRELVAHILPADGAYDRAMRLLVKRNENIRAIVNGHLRKLYTLERDSAPKESIMVLRNVINSINGLKAAMNCIDVNTDTWGAILIFNTSQCLHSNSLKAWEERLDGKREIPTLNMYLDFLETNRITILECTASFSVDSTPTPLKIASKPFNFPRRDGRFDKDKDKFKMMYTLKADFQCLICKKNHLSTSIECQCVIGV